jgi:peptidoglycan L-alanyl-D-glutamate endopeptidase CwlK
MQLIFNEVAEIWPIRIVCGHRGEQEQNEAYDKGFSKLKFPNSKHNKTPSLAVDVVPLKHGGVIDWKDQHEFYALARYALIVAKRIGVTIRWGGDWDMDGDWRDETFLDMAHYELVE